MNRHTVGIIFLLATVTLLITAMNNGGFWWLGVTICCAVALWGIGPSSKDSRK